MGSRWYNTLVLVIWLVSMGWLVVVKIVPSTGWRHRGSNAAPMMPEFDEGLAAVGWEIHWRQRPIGWAAYRLQPQADGTQEARSTVHFDDLPVTQIARELLGTLAGCVNSDCADRGDTPIAMQVETNMTFDRLANSQQFVSTVHVGPLRDLVTLTGTALDGRLHVVASVAESLIAGSTKQTKLELYRGEVDLPGRMSVADALAPIPHLRNLRVGQTWLFQTYRPVPFGRPLQLARAKVQREEMLDWHGQRRLVRRVVLRYEEGASPNAVRQPYSEVWVEPDGTVLKQRLRIANLTVEFFRLAEVPRQFEESR